MHLLVIMAYTLNLMSAEASDDVRLVGGISRCSGNLELKFWKEGAMRWRPGIVAPEWDQTTSAIVCRQLDCGSAVSTERIPGTPDMYEPVWLVIPKCKGSESVLRGCVRERPRTSTERLEIICSESVRLVNGTSLCSGRLEVKSNQLWDSVCEDDFDQQDAEVVCRELGCGAPSVFHGALYGEAKAPILSKEFQCEGCRNSASATLTNVIHQLIGILINAINSDSNRNISTSDSTRNTCSPDKAVGLSCSEYDHVRLVGGTSHCKGTLEMKHHGDRRPVDGWSQKVSLKTAAVVCRQLDCGSAVSTEIVDSTEQSVWDITSVCDGSESSLAECVTKKSDMTSTRLEVVCSEAVRLVNGTSLCSGRVEVKSGQSWVSVFEGDFDQQDAEVVCEELGCGAPSVLQGVLYGDVKTPMWTKQFQCEGNESVLLDCRTSGSARNTSSPDKAVGLTCSEPNDVRLVGGTSHCNGRLEMKHKREWRLVDDYYWNQQSSALVCRKLDCGSAVYTDRIDTRIYIPVWGINASCDGSDLSLRECGPLASRKFDGRREVTCSEFVRLVNGDSLCSGRVEVKSNQSWVSVCADDFDQHDAEVICYELGCGIPLVIQGALFGKAKTPMWTKEFQCKGNESVLFDCGTSDSPRNTCSPDKAVGLTCAKYGVRLLRGTSRCSGELEMNYLGQWRPVVMNHWNLKSSAVVCRQLDCGSALSTQMINRGNDFRSQRVWRLFDSCLGSESSLRECLTINTYSTTSPHILEVICSEAVRLVNGTSLCSGRLEVKSNQSWVSVCEDDFDQKDAKVVCKELGCEVPSVLQGVLNGAVKTPLWTKEFQCEGNESALMDCGTSDSTRNMCSLGKVAGLTCSEPDDIRLVGGTSRCNGTLEMKHRGEWRPIAGWLNVKTALVVCTYLDCGTMVSVRMHFGSKSEDILRINSACDGSEYSLRECASKEAGFNAPSRQELICSTHKRLTFLPNLRFPI